MAGGVEVNERNGNDVECTGIDVGGSGEGVEGGIVDDCCNTVVKVDGS